MTFRNFFSLLHFYENDIKLLGSKHISFLVRGTFFQFISTLLHLMVSIPFQL
jgi:hypothetical protein